MFVLTQVADKVNLSPDTEHTSGITTHTSDRQPAAPDGASDPPTPVGFTNQADSASPERHGDRTDSEPLRMPVDQEVVQDTLVHQQLGPREEGSMSSAAKQDLSPGPTQKRGMLDEEEKRDQSKEEPTLEVTQQDG